MLYATLDDMVRRLRAADTAGRLPSQLKAYSRPALLVIDEIGYLPLDRAGANRVAAELNLSIGRDLAVAGFDGSVGAGW